MEITRGIKPEFLDDRGGITRVFDQGHSIKSVLVITSKAGASRSNHYHKKDMHYCYVFSGKAEWYEKPVEGGKLESAILEAGDMVCTPPMTIHAVNFLDDTVLITLSTQHRNRDDYEIDTVRVTLSVE
jgi:quercetin dioxygenase-like cupin family protein